MAKFEFNGQEFTFDPFEADSAELYQNELDAVIKRGDEIKPTDTVADRIRKECKSVFIFLDALFGEGTHRIIFGESVNVKTALTVFEQVTTTITKELEDFNVSYNQRAKKASVKGKK